MLRACHQYRQCRAPLMTLPDGVPNRVQGIENRATCSGAFFSCLNLATATYFEQKAIASILISEQLIRPLILPLFHRHPVKRFNPLSEVNDEAEDKRETKPAAL